MYRFVVKNLKQLLFIVLLAAFILTGCGKEKQVEPGTYTCNVTLTGGTGKASVETPARVTVSDTDIIATIVWSSPNYDYMIVDGVKYFPVNTEGNSIFEIKISNFDQEIQVVADTVAMSKPHEISYTLNFDSKSLEASDPVKVGSLDLLYAEEFSVDFYENNEALITVHKTDEYILSNNANSPLLKKHSEAVLIPFCPKSVYVAGSATMDLFASCSSLENVKFTSTQESDWSITLIRDEVQKDNIHFVGKYSAPDYERLVAGDCDLAVENTMIFHTPEVKEEIERLNIPVLVDYSSYEDNPLGRMEWIKLYGLICGHLEEAVSFFDDKNTEVLNLKVSDEYNDITVAFFFISSNGYAIVRCPGDYITKMIEMAGGTYVLNDIEADEETNRSTMNMQMESFVASAMDADILIYNSTIDGELSSLEDLIAKDSVLADFTAVKNRNVWCTSQDMYQHSTAIADMIVDFNKIISSQTEENDNLNYLYRLE